MTEVEVQPVRRRGRFGLDRGVVALIAIAVVIGVALLKPWSGEPPASPIPAVAHNEPEVAVTVPPSVSSPNTTLGATNQEPPTPAAPPTARPIDTHSPISLVEARRRAEEAVRYDVFSALLATPSDTDRVKFRDSVPAVAEFGYCDSGALFGSPVTQLALVTAMVPVTSYGLVRVFEKGDPVPIPVGSRETAPDGFVLSVEGSGLPIGHYAVVMRAYDAVRIVPFCVAEVVQLANGAIARFVPQDAANGAARRQLLHDLANIRSE